MMKLDAVDRKILYELDRNSRISFIKLARKLRISPERLRYRVVSLKKEGVIKYFLPVINIAAAGYMTYELFLKLHNMNSELKEKMMSELAENRKVAWLGDLEGNFDIGMIVVVRDRLELAGLMDGLNKKYSDFISRKSISINLQGEFLSRDYIIGQERKNSKQKYYAAAEDTLQLDEMDRKICAALSEDSRVPALEIAKKLKRSADTIILRIKKLEKKIITGYTIMLDNEKISQAHYKILIYMNSKINEEKMVSFCRMNNRAVAVIKTLADWDYEVDVEVENTAQLKEFTMELTKVYSSMIRDYDVLHVTNMSKYTFFPGD
jgi:DNA-binding Lrp family transcriptional regulator